MAEIPQLGAFQRIAACPPSSPVGGIITQINVITTSPENQHALIALLTEAANAVKDVPGWMSATLHSSIGGIRVVNDAQCESMEPWEAVMARLREGGFLERSKQLGAANPGLYEVVYRLTR